MKTESNFTDEMLRISGGTRKQKKKRFILGIGYIWFSGTKIPKEGLLTTLHLNQGNCPYLYVNLSKNSHYNVRKDGIPIKTHTLGAHNKVRLIAEVIK